MHVISRKPFLEGVSDFLCVRRFSPEVSFSEPA